MTNYCNLNCYFCSAEAKNTKEKVLNEDALKICEKIIQSGAIYVSILGGEPTLCTDLVEVVKRLVSNNIFTEIVTNGYKIDEKFVNEIKELDSDLVRIKVSLDSYCENINDSMRGKDSHYYVKRAAQNLNSRNIPFRINMVVNKENEDHIKDTYLFANSIGATSFGFSFVMPIGRGSNLKSVSLRSETFQQLFEILEYEKNSSTKLEKYGLGIESFIYLKEILKNSEISNEDSINISKLKCSTCKYRLLIDDNGDIYPCDMLHFDEFKLGNILDNSISDIWESPKTISISNVSRSNKTKCSECEHKWCNTGCYGIMYEYNKVNHCDLQMCMI
ncbi:MAG: radical SAM protein [Paraclostridium sp.]